MKCEDIEILLVDYIDNSLDEKTRKEVENHLSTCEKCLDSFNENRKILNIMAGSQPSKPDELLRANFYYMLQKEINGTKEGEKSKHVRTASFNKSIFLAAAGIALLVAGTFVGMFISSSGKISDNNVKIETLQSQVDEMKRSAMFSMLKEESSSYRLQGVSYAEELGDKDDKVIEALFNLLNNDKNTNVRMAAAFSLSKFTDNRMVCDSLVASLPRQNEPILQITLINILVGIKEKSALRPIQRILDDSRTNTDVRSIAIKGAQQLTL
ncbi:MAG TPA: HEAT repeat domain-containing protein [Bacteroidales bacterium]|nr:HEAT repeat domain-containing protein [Bacteroidales bacterium]